MSNLPAEPEFQQAYNGTYKSQRQQNTENTRG